jgi:hypothetical protein
MSMFFDFGPPAPGLTRSLDSPMAGQSQNQEPIQRGGVRVSLACVPVSYILIVCNDRGLIMPQCRSRHVKCGAETPSCSRCLQDDKPCFYAKSRRGMRDKNAPQKRATMRENGRESPRSGPFYPGGQSGAYSHGGSSTGSYSRPPSEGSLSPPSLNARLSGKGTSTARLLYLYYK